MAKLTDTQLIILSKAAQREDGAADLPNRINKTAAAKVGASLVVRKLMREIRARPGMPVWRIDEDERRISLIINAAGVATPSGSRSMRSCAAGRQQCAAPSEGATSKAWYRWFSTIRSNRCLVATPAKDKGATLAAWVEETALAAAHHPGLRIMGLAARFRHRTDPPREAGIAVPDRQRSAAAAQHGDVSHATEAVDASRHRSGCCSCRHRGPD